MKWDRSDSEPANPHRNGSYAGTRTQCEVEAIERRVDDDTQIYGLSDKDSEERIGDIIRSHCVPEPKYECIRRRIGEKEILVIKVEEGSDKPYTVWQKGVFVRAGSSDRLAERYELDEIYSRRPVHPFNPFIDLNYVWSL